MSSTDEPHKAPLSSVLPYWFGGPNDDGEMPWRGGLWWRGVDPASASAPATGPNATRNEAVTVPQTDSFATEATHGTKDKGKKKISTKEMQRRTDQLIATRFGHLFDSIERKTLTSLDEKMAAVILWDQLSRNAFRGTSRAFRYDEWAQTTALSILEPEKGMDDKEEESLPWNYEMFACVALMHSEDVHAVEKGMRRFEKLRWKLEAQEERDEGGCGASTDKGGGIARRMKVVERSFVEHFTVIRKFGRYPSRNAALGRDSTPEEVEYLNGKLPKWAESQMVSKTDIWSAPDVSVNVEAKTSDPKIPCRRPIRILVLHGNRATLRKFKSSVRPTLLGLSSPDRPVELDFVKAPNLFREQDTTEKRDRDRLLLPSETSSKGGDNRCWWYATDDVATMEYVGLERSIQALEEYFEQSPYPYDGLLGFAQGGAMAAILAALQDSGQLNHVRFRFVICISGFYCRDTRPEFATLHVQGGGPPPSVHSPDTVSARTDKIPLPSFHTWGDSDKLVEGWRSRVLSEAFDGAMVEPHRGEHFRKAISHWPVQSMRSWLEGLECLKGLKELRSPSLLSAEPEGVPLEDFPAKFAAIKRAMVRCGGAHNIPDPKGLHHQDAIVQDPFWVTVKRGPTDPTIMTHSVTEFVLRVLRMHAKGDTGWKPLLDDLMAVAWCLYPFVGPTKKSKLTRLTEGCAFYSIFRALVDHVPVEEARGYLVDFHLDWVAHNANGWDALNRIDLLFVTGTSLRDEEAVNDDNRTDPSPFAERVHARVATLFATQLSKDLELVQAASSGGGDTPLVERRLALPSKCAEGAPKKGGAIHRKTRLVETVAEDLYGRVEFPGAHKCSVTRYVQVLRVIKLFLQDFSADLKEMQNTKEKFLLDVFRMSDKQWQELHGTPLSDEILNPKPEPLDISNQEQMAPLQNFLLKGPEMLPEAEVVFERGTLINDGRLDLCKQVIGPTGINPLFDSLHHDQHGLVKHLLLGNNVAGNDLGRAVADFIRSGESQLTTWYIAGNRLSLEGIAPVCEALAHDTQVRQLWLKRNPLLPSGAVPLASLLQTNSHLQVLDLSNTGLLDTGTSILMQALHGNRALRYLYMDANGITVHGARAIRDYFRTTESTSLVGLSLGCNRFGDEGTWEIVDGLKEYKLLRRLTLASCGIGPDGVATIAQFLSDFEDGGSLLRFLDLGFLKSTIAVREIPNRMGNEGAIYLADALRTNTTLEALDVGNNMIHQEGFAAMERALAVNTTSALRRLGTQQFGVPLNELTLEKLRAYTGIKETNWAEDSSERDEEDFVDPPHLSEVQSVYRVGNTYKR